MKYLMVFLVLLVNVLIGYSAYFYLAEKWDDEEYIAPINNEAPVAHYDEAARLHYEKYHECVKEFNEASAMYENAREATALDFIDEIEQMRTQQENLIAEYEHELQVHVNKYNEAIASYEEVKLQYEQLIEKVNSQEDTTNE